MTAWSNHPATAGVHEQDPESRQYANYPAPCPHDETVEERQFCSRNAIVWCVDCGDTISEYQR